MMTAQILGCVLIIAAPALKPPKDDKDLLVGLWMMTEYTQNGAALGFGEGTSMELFADGKRLWTEGRQLDTSFERGYRLHAKSNPAAIDLIRSTNDRQKPDIFQCIYKLEGDTLTITLSDAGADRPTKHGEGWRVMKYKRAKKE